MFGSSLSEIVKNLTTSPDPTPEVGLPVFDFKRDFSEALELVRRRGKLFGDKFDIESAVKSFSVTIHYEYMSDGDEQYSGYIEKRCDGWHVGINQYEVEGRQRFTLAHELAHLLFHQREMNTLSSQGKFKDAIKLFRDQNEVSKFLEMEANAFAAEVLMPSSRFRELWDKYNPSDIADMFGVSKYAVDFRAKKLNLSFKG